MSHSQRQAAAAGALLLAVETEAAVRSKGEARRWVPEGGLEGRPWLLV